MFFGFLKNIVCFTVSTVLSSYLLISSLAYINNSAYITDTTHKTFGQVLEIPVKKNKKEFSCGYLKFIASTNLADKVLKSKLQQLSGQIFPNRIPEFRRYFIYSAPRVQTVYSQPDKLILKCSFLI